MIELTRRFVRDERAATAIEYSLIAAGVASAIVVAVNALGVNVKGMWTSIKTALGS
ncbi:MAG: Flp family type IVb pilin [Pseudolabrys sp.]|nr:Flp family type IVb pilin [Pseudolabrys sp.]MBV9954456.1 Flp family type IVb pilin [Pseudolabrys sp.]